MALRRPPTRIELKNDDIEDYVELKNERMLADSDKSHDDASFPTKRGVRCIPTPKQSAQKQQRIGITRR